MNDHVVLTINGLVVYESHIGTRPPVPMPAPTPEPTPTPAPTPTPDPEPPKPKVDYSAWRNTTRGGIELAVRQGIILPAGWDWDDAFASGFVKDTADVMVSGSSGGAAQSDLGWTNGNPIYATRGVQTYNVTPSLAWLQTRPENRSLAIASGSTSRGARPANVTYTIAGITKKFLGDNQIWESLDNDFPVVTGPFTVTVKMLQANGALVGPGFALAVELLHTP